MLALLFVVVLLQYWTTGKGSCVGYKEANAFCGSVIAGEQMQIVNLSATLLLVVTPMLKPPDTAKWSQL